MRSKKEKARNAPFSSWFSYIGKEVNYMALLSFALIILFIWVAYDVVFNDKGDR